jgi:hypothetical protein
MGVAERLSATVREFFGDLPWVEDWTKPFGEPSSKSPEDVGVEELKDYSIGQIVAQGLGKEIIPKEYSATHGEPSIFMPRKSRWEPGINAMIKHADPKVAFKLNKLRQIEMKARGPSPKYELLDDPHYQAIQGPEDPIAERKLVSDLVRKGTFYHGRGTYPEARLTESELITRHYGKEIPQAPTLALAREKAHNLGEFVGSSLSTSADVAGGFARKHQNLSDQLNPLYVKTMKEMTEAYNAHNNSLGNELSLKLNEIPKYISQPIKIARVTPLYGGPPEEKLLYGWEEESGRVLQEIYREAVQDRTKDIIARDQAGKNVTQEEYDFLASPRYFTFKQTIKDADWGDVTDESSDLFQFNKAITEKALERGYKGILYHPKRGGYDELELKMFDPKDVLILDTRDWKGYRKDPTYEGPGQDPGILRTLKSKDRATGETLEQFGESIPIVDNKGPKARAIEQFTQMTKGKPTSLRDWYKKVDIGEAVREVVEEVYGKGAMGKASTVPRKMPTTGDIKAVKESYPGIEDFVEKETGNTMHFLFEDELADLITKFGKVK